MLSKTIINEFDDNFDLIRTIQSEKIDILKISGLENNPIITKDKLVQLIYHQCF